MRWRSLRTWWRSSVRGWTAGRVLCIQTKTSTWVDIWRNLVHSNEQRGHKSSTQKRLASSPREKAYKAFFTTNKFSVLRKKIVGNFHSPRNKVTYRHSSREDERAERLTMQRMRGLGVFRKYFPKGESHFPSCRCNFLGLIDHQAYIAQGKIKKIYQTWPAIHVIRWDGLRIK